MSWKKSTGARIGYERTPHSCQSQTFTSHVSECKDAYHMTCIVLFLLDLFASYLEGPLRESHHENDHPEENVEAAPETRMVHKGTDANHFGMEHVDFSVVFSFDVKI